MNATSLRRLLTTLTLLVLTGTAATFTISCGDLPDEKKTSTTGEDREGYPAGPFGKTEGAILENLSFKAPDGSAVQLSDFHQDGSNTLLLVSTSAEWCTACKEEQPKLENLHKTYGNDGLVVLVSLFEDINYEPAGPALAQDWKDEFGLSFDVVSDEPFVFESYYDATLTPMTMIVDLRNMEILKINTGFDQSAIEAIIKAKL